MELTRTFSVVLRFYVCVIKLITLFVNYDKECFLLRQ